MTDKFKDVGIVILAAGKGKRMQSELPKVMHLLNGRPLVDYVVGAAEELRIKPVVVIGEKTHSVKNFLKERAEYATQTEQLGTGHAVMSAEPILKGKADNIVVLYGDMPFIRPQSIKNLLEEHQKKNNILTMSTVKVEDFSGWKAQFADFGRIIRNEKGEINKIVEKKDATPQHLDIKEVNSAVFCFQADWLWTNLKNLKNINAQGEYYLTDLVEMAIKQGANISSVSLNPREAVGINTKEHLNMIENLN